MNTSPINAFQGSLVRNEVNYAIDRIDAPLTPRRKLVVPAVFDSTKQSNFCNTPTKSIGRPNKLKIPVAFSSPTSCKSDPATWSSRSSSSPKNKVPKTPTLASPSIGKDQGVTTRPTLDVPLPMEDDTVAPTAAPTISTSVDHSLPTIQSANVLVSEGKPAMCKSRSKKHIRIKQRQLAREEQKKALMLQLLSLNQKIEAVKLERSSRQLVDEDVEVIELIDEDDDSINAEDEFTRSEQVKVIPPAAPLIPLEPEDQNTAERHDDEQQEEEVVVVDTESNDTQDMIDDQPDCAATEEHAPGKTRKIRKINRKRLVKLGSFFARRRQREQNRQ